MEKWPWIFEVSNEIASLIDLNRDKLCSILTRYETFATAEDEIERSIRTLRGLHQERPHIENVKIDSLTTFQPINQPLYALVLFGIVPSLMVQTVMVRPASLTSEVVQRLWSIVIPKSLSSRLHFINLSKQKFIDRCVRNSDAIIFTGRLVGAQQVLKSRRNGAIFIFNGTGFNPIVIQRDANIKKACQDTLRATMYNSGQDCAAPKFVLVQRTIADEVISQLRYYMGNLSVGSITENPKVDVGPLARPASIEKCVSFFLKERGHIQLGGTIRVAESIVEPTLIVNELNTYFQFPELYAPVINLAVYNQWEDVESLFNTEQYQRCAMYASIYGNNFGLQLRNTKLLHNQSVLDFENGNYPFGGFGPEASFFKVGGHRPIRGPVLISAVLSNQEAASRQNDLAPLTVPSWD